MDFAIGYDFADVKDDADEGPSLVPLWKLMTELVGRYTGKTVSVHRSIFIDIVYGTSTTLFATKDDTTTFFVCSRPRLDASVDVSRGA